MLRNARRRHGRSRWINTALNHSRPNMGEYESLYLYFHCPGQLLRVSPFLWVGDCHYQAVTHFFVTFRNNSGRNRPKDYYIPVLFRSDMALPAGQIRVENRLTLAKSGLFSIVGYKFITCSGAETVRSEFSGGSDPAVLVGSGSLPVEIPG